MRRQYRDSAALSTDGLKEGQILFTLVTADRDTYKTRLLPQGARFRPAKPWIDCHQTDECKNTIGKMTPHYQGPDALRVLVDFDMADAAAAEVYRKHVDGFIEGCSIGFDPIKWSVVPEPGSPACRQCVDGYTDDEVCKQCKGTCKADVSVVYTEYWVLEGSSCAVPSNPQALMVRSARAEESVERDALAVVPVKRTTVPAPAVVPPAAVPQASAPTHHLRADSQVNTFRPKDIRPMKPEHRSHHRYMIGDAMRAAEGHMEAIGMHEKPEHRKAHRDAALSSMERAAHMARMVQESMEEGHEDAPADAALIGNMMRTCTVAGDAELATAYETTQRAALPFAGRTWAEVGKAIGSATPEDLRVRVAALETSARAYKNLMTQQVSAARATEQSDRVKLVLQLRASAAQLEPGLEAEIMGFDPVGYEPISDAKPAGGGTRRGTPWTLDNIRRYQTDVEGTVAQITRTAPLRTVDGSPAPVTLQPAQPVVVGKLSADEEAGIAEASRCSGIPIENLRAQFMRTTGRTR